VRSQVAIALAGAVALFALNGCQTCLDDSAPPDPPPRPVFIEGGSSFRPRLASPLGHLLLRIRDAGDDE
jgi:hypothetical protein